MLYYDVYDQLMQGLVTASLLSDVRRRAQEQALAWDMAAGNYMPFPGEISPVPKAEEAVQAYWRLLRLVEPIGPQILRTRLWGIGNVQWGDPDQGGAGDREKDRADTAEIDAMLEDVDLMTLTRRCFEQAFTGGITAVWARMDEDKNKPVLTRLGGYLQPLTDPDNVDSIDALLQAWQPDGATKGDTWTVRVYDYVAMELRIHERVRDPSRAIGLRPTDVRPLDTVPHVMIAYLDAAGLPVGEMVQGMHLVRQNIAIQLRIQRVAEMYGFPVPVVKDLANVPRDFGPGKVVQVGANGSFDYAFPPGLDELIQHYQSNIERIRDNFALPGGALGGQTPSGEALKEANARYAQVNRYYADGLGSMLTRAVSDLARLRGIQPVEVSVSSSDPNRQQEVISLVKDLYNAGVIHLSAAARAVQEFIPSWSDEDLDEWIDSQSSSGSAARIRQLLGGNLGVTGGGSGGTGQTG